MRHIEGVHFYDYFQLGNEEFCRITGRDKEKKMLYVIALPVDD